MYPAVWWGIVWIVGRNAWAQRRDAQPKSDARDAHTR